MQLFAFRYRVTSWRRVWPMVDSCVADAGTCFGESNAPGVFRPLILLFYTTEFSQTKSCRNAATKQEWVHQWFQTNNLVRFLCPCVFVSFFLGGMGVQNSFHISFLFSLELTQYWKFDAVFWAQNAVVSGQRKQKLSHVLGVCWSKACSETNSRDILCSNLMLFIYTVASYVRFRVPGTRTGFLPRSNSIGEGIRFPTRYPKSNSLFVNFVQIHKKEVFDFLLLSWVFVLLFVRPNQGYLPLEQKQPK